MQPDVMITLVIGQLLTVLPLALQVTSVTSSYSPYRNVTTTDQLPSFKMKTQGAIGLATTTYGVPVAIEDLQTINGNLILNENFLEAITHLDRERIPERVVHAKGTGAFGYFQVTHDLSDICRAKVFRGAGTTTPLVARFSPVFQNKGGTDVGRETRGMAIKFYTEEGNYDLLTLNIEMFFMKDPGLFPDFVHVFNKNPKTQVTDQNSIWDFITRHPEALHGFMRVFADRGIPAGYRYLPGFGIHTFEMINDAGERHFVKIHVLPDAGIRTLTTAEAERIQARDLDFANRDLYEAIANGIFPTWTLSVQVISFEDSTKAGFDIFDITKSWPLDQYPLRPVGTLVLDRNPENQFAEIEQLAFNSANLVPGIRGIDKVFEARALSYRDTQNYRLGGNFNDIFVNFPKAAPAKSYVRDGVAPVLDNGGESPNYAQNSFNGPGHYLRNDPPRLTVYTDPEPNNFDQAGDIYVHEMSVGERCRFVAAVTTSLQPAEGFIQKRAVKWYTVINAELGSRIANALQNNMTEAEYCQ